MTARPGWRSDRRPPAVRDGRVVGRLTETAADALGLRAGHARRRRHERCVRELPRRRPARAGRRVSTRAARPAGSASTGTARSRCPARSSRRRRCPAGSASAPRWPPRGGRSTGSATRSSAAGDRPPSGCSRRRPTRRPAPTASSSCRTWPASGRRSGTRPRPACFAGLTLGHGRAHLARAILEASALAIRHVADADARGRASRSPRCAPAAARPASDGWNQIKADVTGFPVAGPGRPRDRRAGLGDARRGRRSARTPTCRPRSGR